MPPHSSLPPLAPSQSQPPGPVIGRRGLLLVILAALVFALMLGLGANARLAEIALSAQREYQNALARALRALGNGEPGAVTAFLSLCFTYGFLHAVGPGHGKAVIAAYGFGRAASLRWLVWLAALSSLAQASVAVALVYSGVWAFNGARDRVAGLADRIEPLSAAAIMALGLFLCWRGWRRLRPALAPTTSAHTAPHEAECGCGHAHAPPIDAALATRSWREAAALVAGVALRPCTGALFVLILTWRFGLNGIGIAGAYAMGLGTMMVTALAAVAAVTLRRGVGLSLPGLVHGPRIAAGLEIAVGVLILALAVGMLIQTF